MAKAVKKKAAKKAVKKTRRAVKLTPEQRAEKARAKRLAAAKKKLAAMKAKQAKQLASFKAKLEKAFAKFEAKAMAEVDKPKRKRRKARKAGMNKQDLVEVPAKASTRTKAVAKR